MTSPEHTAEALASVSISSAVVAWFAETLPLLQWTAALAATLSGLTATAWIIFKFYKVWKLSHPSVPEDDDDRIS